AHVLHRISMSPLVHALVRLACAGLFAAACSGPDGSSGASRAGGSDASPPAQSTAGVGGEPPAHGAATAHIANRLGPQAFGRPAAPHVPVAQIGQEARAVLVGPERIPIAEERGVRLDDGTSSFDVEIPEAVRRLPKGSFELLVQEVPEAVQGLGD